MHHLLPATHGVVASPAGSSGMLVLPVAMSVDTFTLQLLWFLFIAHVIFLCRWIANDGISKSLSSATVLADVVAVAT